MTKLIMTLCAAFTAVLCICFLSHPPPQRLTERAAQSMDTECQKWMAKVSALSDSEKQRLARDGAVFKIGIGMILSDSLAPDCRLRNEMAAYFDRVLGGRSDGKEGDRQFAARNSRAITAVIRSIWPSLSGSKALTREGLGTDKYNLLAEPALDESDLAPLVSDILDAESIDNDLAFVIFSRPLPTVRPAILRMQAVAERADAYSWQIVNLVLLQNMDEPSALPKLRRLSRNPRLTAAERKCVASIIMKAERGDEIIFKDVENLEYEDAAQGTHSR